MVLRRPNSKDIVSVRNSNSCGSSILENFRGNWFSRINNFENYAGISFRKATFWGSKKEFNFANLAKIREIFFL